MTPDRGGLSLSGIPMTPAMKDAYCSSSSWELRSSSSCSVALRLSCRGNPGGHRGI